VNGRRNRTTKSWIETGVDFRTPAVLSSETDGYEVNTTYFNTGRYTISEASRLTGVSRGRIRRWLRGYHYRSRQKSYTSRPLWRGQWEPIDHTLALGFLDLIEIRFVDAFRRVGVSWATLRRANERAQEMFGGSHPFCTNRFVTDGREIFVELHEQTGETSLLEIARSQQVFTDIVRPFPRDLEFDENEGLVRWWPLGKDRFVVIDPRRNFGSPIVVQHGVPTEVLAKAAKVSRSISEVVHWFAVPEEEIHDAVEYEQQLAA
jgi:uncharacterized protein (DUF433 family)